MLKPSTLGLDVNPKEQLNTVQLNSWTKIFFSNGVQFSHLFILPIFHTSYVFITRMGE